MFQLKQDQNICRKTEAPLILDRTLTDGLEEVGKGAIWLAASGANKNKARRDELVVMLTRRAEKICVED